MFQTPFYVIIVVIIIHISVITDSKKVPLISFFYIIIYNKIINMTRNW